ncbi:unnamed protein product [Durusdinium trenchii]|uniref:Uncharacterized protein n=1 Tax=Durusdinium trenchii TaxID=1381693 RepID=A0ABP0HSG2_9DINO
MNGSGLRQQLGSAGAVEVGQGCPTPRFSRLDSGHVSKPSLQKLVFVVLGASVHLASCVVPVSRDLRRIMLNCGPCQRGLADSTCVFEEVEAGAWAQTSIDHCTIGSSVYR